MCARDRNENVGEAGNQRAEDYSVSLVSRGVASEVDRHPPSPAYSARFARIAGIDLGASRAMADERNGARRGRCAGILELTLAGNRGPCSF